MCVIFDDLIFLNISILNPFPLNITADFFMLFGPQSLTARDIIMLMTALNFGNELRVQYCLS